MNNFDIHKYLGGFDKTTGKGKCKSCSKSVIWKRERVRGYKRASFPNASAADKLFFAIIKDETPSTSQTNQHKKPLMSKKMRRLEISSIALVFLFGLQIRTQ
jgi:hypothetical protein